MQNFHSVHEDSQVQGGFVASSSSLSWQSWDTSKDTSSSKAHTHQSLPYLPYWVTMRWPPLAKSNGPFTIFLLALGLSRLSWPFFNPSSPHPSKMLQLLGDNSWSVKTNRILQRTSSYSILSSHQNVLYHPLLSCHVSFVSPYCTSPPTSTNICLYLIQESVISLDFFSTQQIVKHKVFHQ